jgi:hypothetical protein
MHMFRKSLLVTGLGLAHLCAIATEPVITSVSEILPQAIQTITISGENFGALNCACRPHASHLQLTNR